MYDMFRGDSTASLAARVDTLTANARSRRDPPAPEPIPHPAARYVGTYADSVLGTLRVEQRGDSLVVRMGDAWGVAAGVANAPDALAASLMGGRRRLDFDFASGSVQLAGRIFRRMR